MEKKGSATKSSKPRCASLGAQTQPAKRGRRIKGQQVEPDSSSSPLSQVNDIPPTEKWSLGILNDRFTGEVPGTVLLLSPNCNEPFGLQYQPQDRSASSLPSPYESRRPPLHTQATKKTKTLDGKILLEPQPDDSMNDPLNWPAWRRDCALLSLGFYCMLGGGMTPILAAGFNDVAKTFGITYSRVALTTGLYMVGLGVGSLVFSPTAILFGKRPVYLGSAIMFILTSIWCAKAPNFANLATARVFQGISVSPVECLPSATIAEIFFLHERAFRVGIYTLLLLGGKNLIPLISAAIIQAKEWRWVFYIVAIVAGFGLVVLFLFVPETFWDRTPRPKSRRPSTRTRLSSHPLHPSKSNPFMKEARETNVIEEVMTPHPKRLHREQAHVDFIESVTEPEHEVKLEVGYGHVPEDEKQAEPHTDGSADKKRKFLLASLPPHPTSIPMHSIDGVVDGSVYAEMPHLHTLNSPYYVSLEKNTDCLNAPPASVHPTPPPNSVATSQDGAISHPISTIVSADSAATTHTLMPVTSPTPTPKSSLCYTAHLRHAPRKTYIQTLHPWNGGLIKANWFLIALRPFVLYTYPSVLWSALVYSLSVGWLIVLSESVASIYRNRASYNFSALGAGLVYLSPFIGGILGTVVAGKVSDITVRFMARKNGGVYEPEFRLVMAIPIAISTGIGLIGFGWSAQERDAWIVPTVFFGVISFGCSLGSTTAITFCVDSYRQYAGEALVTLNFSKNIFHGLMFSLFFPGWLEKDGPREVFVVIGAIQIACLISAVPMYIHLREAGKDGERAEELDGEV